MTSFTATPAFGTSADGLSTAKVTLVLADAAGNPLGGRRVVLEATGFDNSIQQPPSTNGLGATQGTLRTSVGERKSVTAVVDPGPDEIRLGPITVEFMRIQSNWRFVRTSGLDSNDGLTPNTAWRTLGHAITQVGAGNVLYVGAGLYTDTLVITTTGTPDAGLTIRGDTGGEFTGDAGEVLLDAGAMRTGIELRGARYVTLRGLSIRGSDPGAGHGGALYASGASDCSILECRLYENRRAIELENTTSIWVEGNRISANLGDAIRLAGTTGTRIRGNLIYSNGGDGIELNPASTDVLIEFNTLYRNANDQIHEIVAGSTGMVQSNILSEGGRGLGLAASSNLGLSTNLSWLVSNDTPAITYSADPILIDPAGADGILGGVGCADDNFRVDSLSPTLDAGAVPAEEIAMVLSGSLSTLGTRDDDLMDGEGADQKLANLGFHYPLPLEPFTSLQSMGARMGFVTGGNARLSTRAWERAGDQWAAPTLTQDLGTDVRWLIQRVSTGPKPEEIVAAQIATATGAKLLVRTWDARRWSDDTPAVLSTAIASENVDERGFDLEYEAQSGRAMLVRADGANNVKFQILDEGTWSAPLSTFAPALSTGTVLWTELLPRTGTNELALVTLDDKQVLSAALWDGTQWTRQITLATQVNSLRDFRAFDVAWESLSGDLLVSWGYSQFAEETRYATLTRATDTWTTGQFVSTDALGMFLCLASDPTSDRIIGVFGEGFTDDDVGVSVWNGSSWSNTAELTLAGIPQSRAMAVGWLGTSGLGFAVYRDQAQTGAFEWAYLNGGGWRRAPGVSLPGVGKMVRVQTRIIPGTERVLMLMLDDAGSLWAIEHDGTNWVLKNGDAPLATGLDPNNPGRSFDFDLRSL